MLRLLLALSFLVGSSTAMGDNSWGRLPGTLPDVSAWQKVSGEYQTDSMAITYLLYVNPVHEALYEVIRYRVRFLTPKSHAERSYSTSEKLVWNEHPGHAHLRCFELAAGPTGAVSAWREMSHGTRQYDVEMRMVMQLMMLHHKALEEREEH